MLLNYLFESLSNVTVRAQHLPHLPSTPLSVSLPKNINLLELHISFDNFRIITIFVDAHFLYHTFSHSTRQHRIKPQSQGYCGNACFFHLLRTNFRLFSLFVRMLGCSDVLEPSLYLEFSHHKFGLRTVAVYGVLVWP